MVPLEIDFWILPSSETQVDYSYRIALLESFRQAIQRWFDGDYGTEGEQNLKRTINLASAAARQAVIDAGCFRRVNVAPPPVVGGMVAQNVDLFDHVFHDFWGMSVIPMLADTVDRAIGVYRAAEATGDTVGEASQESSASNLQLWDALHPAVTAVSQSRFSTGHFADAVEAALKAVNGRVRDHHRAATGEERDGAELMFAALGGESPTIALASLQDETGRNIQQGYMHLFAGAMRGVRNPKAHDNIDLDPGRAIHHLFLASLLMEKLDEALSR